MSKTLLIADAINKIVQFDSDPKFRTRVRREALGFTDSVSLPQGALQGVLPAIHDVHTDEFFVNYIPENPVKIPGADKLVYTRVGNTGRLVYGNSGGEATKGRLGIDMKVVEIKVQRPYGVIPVSNHDVERLALAYNNRSISGAINLLEELRRSAVYAWLSERDDILGIGKPNYGLLGFLSSPDIALINLSTPLDASNTPDQNLAVLSQAVQRVTLASKGKYKPTTVVMPDTLEVALSNQMRADASDKSVLDTFIQNQRTVLFDGGRTGPFEVGTSSKLYNYTPGRSAMIFFCRRLDCVEQVVPKALTYSDPRPVPGGYEIDVHGDVTSLILKQPTSAAVVTWPNA